MDFKQELSKLINRASRENGSNTPDFLLAQFLIGCLESFDTAVRAREDWYGRNPSMGPAGVILSPDSNKELEG